MSSVDDDSSIRESFTVKFVEVAKEIFWIQCLATRFTGVPLISIIFINNILCIIKG
jgi:hypothetical protein